MKILHTADLHIEQGPRLEDQREILARIVKIARDERPDLIVVAGDIYGHTVPHRSTPSERLEAMSFVRNLSEIATVVIVRGNHDHAEDIEGLRYAAANPVWVWGDAVHYGYGRDGDPNIHIYTLPYPWKSHWMQGRRASSVEEAQAEIQSALDDLFATWRASIELQRRADPDAVHVVIGHVQVRGTEAGPGVVLAGQEIEVTRDQLEDIGADYVALGHIHARQTIGDRIHYCGSPWHTEHGRHLPDRSVSIVEVEAGKAPVIRQIPTHCRPFVTLDYRWSQPEGEDAPRWTKNPTDDVGCIVGAEVKARLTVPAQHRASCPWEEELQLLRDHGAHRVIPEPIVEPMVRVRAPMVAEARSLPDKLVAYWDTLGTEVTAEERAMALECLDTLGGGE